MEDIDQVKLEKILINIRAKYYENRKKYGINSDDREFYNIWLYYVLRQELPKVIVKLCCGTGRFMLEEKKVVLFDLCWITLFDKVIDIFTDYDEVVKYEPVIFGEIKEREDKTADNLNLYEVAKESETIVFGKIGVSKNKLPQFKKYLNNSLTKNYKRQLFQKELNEIIPEIAETDKTIEVNPTIPAEPEIILF